MPVGTFQTGKDEDPNGEINTVNKNYKKVSPPR